VTSNGCSNGSNPAKLEVLVRRAQPRRHRRHVLMTSTKSARISRAPNREATQ
jgi:hypothetical protein